MLAGVAAVLFGLQVLYLIVGNLVLRSHLVQRAVGSAHGFTLEFADAYTLWPGHARVRDLSLRVEDYNVQFEVAIASADVDIALAQLPFKKFRITHLDARGTRFRMRHKLIAVGQDAERVAAYPPIKGFADPPYFFGVRRPPTPAKDYDLWEVRVENVLADVQEVWVMEYRYWGSGVARGSFVVQPERWVQVEPASLDFTGGTLHLGPHLVAQRMTGRMTCDIPDMDVQATEGLEVLRDIGARVKLELRGGELRFLQAYLARWGSARYAGNAEWLLDASVLRGVVLPQSRLELRATPLELHHDFADLSGPLNLSLSRPGTAPELQLALSAPQLTASRPQQKAEPPRVHGLALGLQLLGVDLKRDVSLGAVRAGVERVVVPDLGWVSRSGVTLGGRAELGFALARSQQRELSGSGKLQVLRGQLRHADVSAASDVQSELSFTRASDTAPLELRRAVLELTNASVRSGKKRTEPFSARVDASGARIQPAGGVRANGAVRVRVSSAKALLPLVVGDPLPSIGDTLLDLQELDARADVALSSGRWEVRHLDARSGDVQLRGLLSKHAKDQRGAFLLSSGIVNVGVALKDGETDVAPFVSKDWLAATWQDLAQHSHRD